MTQGQAGPELPAVAALPGLLTAIHDDLADAPLVLDAPYTRDAEVLRTRVLTQIDAHLLPRAGGRNIPVVAVLGGSTGAGKSTLMNSMLGTEVSEAGVLRPTTREAVLVHHPETSLAHVPLADRTVTRVHPGVPEGLALIDAPDLDSYDEANRKAAAELLEAADLWLFVTTAARYGDAIPWTNLRLAHGRGLQVAIVFNRVPVRILTEVRADLMARLTEAGLGEVPMFVIPDIGPHEGLLPDDDVAELRDWLHLATRGEQGRGIIARTTRGAWGALRENLTELSRSYVRQANALEALGTTADSISSAIAVDLTTALRSGSAAVGAPLTRWLTAASSGGALADLLTDDLDSVKAGFGGRRVARRNAAASALGKDIHAAIHTVLADAIHDVATQIAEHWREAGVGAEVLLADVPETTAADAAARAERILLAWGAELDALVADHVRPDVVDAPATAQLLAAAVGGVRGAARVVSTLLGSGLIEQGREVLAHMCSEAITQTARPYHLALGDSAAQSRSVVTGLRLRLGELGRYLDAA
ncbi:MAG: GTPase domain-containing protein [Bowdeniella nasicola]|nr:GTPase domain-containing protein [Bowdeniella nasicola]